MGEAKARKLAMEKARLARRVPENIHLLHGGELGYRQQSVQAIEVDPELMDHIELIEANMDYIHFFASRPPKGMDQETVNLLAGRMWNDMAASLGQALRGYYQISAMIQRDILEVAFLLLLFRRDPARIKEWREADHDTRRRKFQPGKIRDVLDTYDGYTEGRRGQAYRMFCEYAAHATWQGFELMGPAGAKPQIGPFFDPPLLKAMLVELAQLAAQAGANASHWFDANGDPQAWALQLRRMEVSSDWLERYFGRPADRRAIRELNEALKLFSAEN
jgi:hypothetical protein